MKEFERAYYQIGAIALVLVLLISVLTERIGAHPIDAVIGSVFFGVAVIDGFVCAWLAYRRGLKFLSQCRAVPRPLELGVVGLTLAAVSFSVGAWVLPLGIACVIAENAFLSMLFSRYVEGWVNA